MSPNNPSFEGYFSMLPPWPVSYTHPCYWHIDCKLHFVQDYSYSEHPTNPVYREAFVWLLSQVSSLLPHWGWIDRWFRMGRRWGERVVVQTCTLVVWMDIHPKIQVLLCRRLAIYNTWNTKHYTWSGVLFSTVVQMQGLHNTELRQWFVPPSQSVPSFPGIPVSHFIRLEDPSGFDMGLA